MAGPMMKCIHAVSCTDLSAPQLSEDEDGYDDEDEDGEEEGSVDGDSREPPSPDSHEDSDSELQPSQEE